MCEVGKKSSKCPSEARAGMGARNYLCDDKEARGTALLETFPSFIEIMIRVVYGMKGRGKSGPPWSACSSKTQG